MRTAPVFVHVAPFCGRFSFPGGNLLADAERRQALAELSNAVELGGDHNLAALVDESPLVFHPDGRQPLREVVDFVELERDHLFPALVDKSPFAFLDGGQAFAERVRCFECRSDDDGTMVINESMRASVVGRPDRNVRKPLLEWPKNMIILGGVNDKAAGFINIPFTLLELFFPRQLRAASNRNGRQTLREITEERARVNRRKNHLARSVGVAPPVTAGGIHHLKHAVTVERNAGEWSFDHDRSGLVDEGVAAKAGVHPSQTLAEVFGVFERRRNDDLARGVDESPFAFHLDRKESRVRWNRCGCGGCG